MDERFLNQERAMNERLLCEDRFAVGETCYQAWCELFGRPVDSGSPPRRTKEDAALDGETWAFWLSDREQARAAVVVIAYRVDEVDDYGKPCSMSSIRMTA